MFWKIKNVNMKNDVHMINRKHEIFWNIKNLNVENELHMINRKHEMFWNVIIKSSSGQ